MTKKLAQRALHGGVITSGLVLALLLGACSTARAPSAPPVSRPVPSSPPVAVTPAPTPVPQPVPATPTPSARATPIAPQVISLNGACSQRESDGFREQATLQVEKDDVRGLDWKIWVGNRGSCSFNMNEFVQTQKAPHIELRAKDGSGCRLLIYQDKRWITLAHANCQKRCTGDIYDEAWPVMFDRSGACGKIG